MSRSKIRRFLFDSTYQVVTWVWIGLSIAAYFYYLSKDSSRGVLWSGISLAFAALVMIILVASQHFSASGSEERPELSIDKAWPALSVGSPVRVFITLRNRGKRTARHVSAEGSHYLRPKGFKDRLVYEPGPREKHPPIAPGGYLMTEAGGTDPLTPLQLAALKAQDWMFFTFVNVTYRDGDGESYNLPLCLLYEPRWKYLRFAPSEYWPVGYEHE
jgi:hypothetical protein